MDRLPPAASTHATGVVVVLKRAAARRSRTSFLAFLLAG
jgi:hypothetical protein